SWITTSTKNADVLIDEEIWPSAWDYVAMRWQTARNVFATNWNNASRAVSRKNSDMQRHLFPLRNERRDLMRPHGEVWMLIWTRPCTFWKGKNGMRKAPYLAWGDEQRYFNESFDILFP